MKTLGIVTEYNPFHNGHLTHINKSKILTKSKHTIVVMSGNFVQRGEPAIIDKYLRTKMALLNGADLVVELPVYYATSSAEYFALAAVSLLNATGIVDNICFGSELGDLSELKIIAEILSNENDEYKNVLKQELSEGVSYPVARDNALNKILKTNSNILNNPNNILSIEYLKALIKTNSSIKPYTIRREDSGYHSKELTGRLSSATAIRQGIINKDYDKIKRVMPEDCFNLIIDEVNNGSIPYTLNNLSSIFQYIIKTISIKDLQGILDVTEGLQNRIVRLSSNNYNINDIITQIKTKRYTFTKIQRAILHIILGIKKDDFDFFNNRGGVQYIRCLGFKKESQFLLKKMEEKASLPIITNLKSAEKKLNSTAIKMLEKEIKTTDIYYLAKNNIKHSVYCKNYEYIVPLVII